ncbi:MAG TPA: hypothetical protein VH590_02695, partial [Ktedonobacterales bacterium]
MLPSFVRVYYYTILALLRQHPLALIGLLSAGLPLSLEQRFVDLAPSVARHLALDFKRASRLLQSDHPAEEALRLLSRHPLVMAPRLNWMPEHLEGMLHKPLLQCWQQLWSACWQQAAPDNLGCLAQIVQPSRLLIAPVAPGSLPGQAALQHLRKQWEQDRQEHAWVIPPPTVFLYDEPLTDWLLRPLLSGKWFFRLCQALAALASAVPALVQQRVTAQQAKADAAAWQPGRRRKPDTRRIPPMPQGSVTAEAIFFYAVAAWRVALPADASDQLILPDARLLAPRQFGELLALAITATEHLLWDSAQAARALPAGTPERRKLLRRSLLPPRLRRHFADLSQRSRWRRAQTKLLPPWGAWETLLSAALDLIDARLATSIVPAAITGATLESLLRQPRAALAGQYLYHTTLGNWLRAALPADLPGVDALLPFCQTLTEALGAWPSRTPGAPASAEQAALAVLWNVKLALEARINDSPAQERALPRQKDGRLAVWLGGGPLPAEALELATVIAPLVARVLFESSWEAAREGKALLMARLQAGEAESIEEMTRRLMLRARRIRHPHCDEAAQEAWEKLRVQLKQLVLPSDISLPLLTGDRNMVGTVDFLREAWYSNSRSTYQFLGSFFSFTCSFIRFPARPALLPDGNSAGGPPGDRLPGGSKAQDGTLADDRAAVRVLGLILQATQGTLRTLAATGLKPTDGELLLAGLFGNNSGRGLLEKFAAQGVPVAREVIKLWQSRPRQAQGDEQAIVPRMATENMELHTALARFLAYPPVEQSPAMRLAVGDLFELPTRWEQPIPSRRTRLGMLERLQACTTRQRLRAELLRALDALEHVPIAQQRALGRHLVVQEPMVLALRLLEQGGWGSPPWLRLPASGAGKTTEERKRQLFMLARRYWHHLLSSDLSASRARALAAELAGAQFWSHPWIERLHEEQIRRFYR